MRYIILFVAMMTAMLNAQTLEKKLVVELSSGSQSYKLGEAISITARLKNQGAEPISIYKHLLWGHRGGLVLDITDASGHKVEPEELDEDSVIPTTLDDPKSFLEVPSEYEWGVVRNDKTTNLFRKPGIYTVRVKYLSPVPRKYFPKGTTPWATEDGLVISAPITVEIK